MHIHIFSGWKSIVMKELIKNEDYIIYESIASDCLAVLDFISDVRI